MLPGLVSCIGGTKYRHCIVLYPSSGQSCLGPRASVSVDLFGVLGSSYTRPTPWHTGLEKRNEESGREEGEGNGLMITLVTKYCKYLGWCKQYIGLLQKVLWPKLFVAIAVLKVLWLWPWP